MTEQETKANKPFVLFRIALMMPEIRPRVREDRSEHIVAKQAAEAFWWLVADELPGLDRLFSPEEQAALPEIFRGFRREAVSKKDYRDLWVTLLKDAAQDIAERQVSVAEMTGKLRGLTPGQSLALIDALDRYSPDRPLFRPIGG